MVQGDDEEVQNEAWKSILRFFYAWILSDFFGVAVLGPGDADSPGTVRSHLIDTVRIG